ncbi:hypothetical protein [Nocardioides caldifontis]|uniref:hypothetical protein n=1 Tax=Nocardioides caldifontis TaxID=2588938 RepID=UPI0011E0263A|nr:hypothetical protein [Nocardioides caldifontis]
MRTPARRRQRSARVTVAATLLVLASGGLVATLPLPEPGPLRIAVVVGLLLVWAAARIIHTELVTTRQEHARDRARQARAYTSLLEARGAEQAALARRLAGREREVRELEAVVRLVERRAVHAEQRLRRGELEAVDQAQVDTVVDLLAWEDQGNRRWVPEQRKQA